MSDNTAKQSNHWQELANDAAAPSSPSARSAQESQPALPSTELHVRLTHGVWFGTAMGIGFAIGFLISFLALAGFVGFVILSRFPGLFS